MGTRFRLLARGELAHDVFLADISINIILLLLIIITIITIIILYIHITTIT